MFATTKSSLETPAKRKVVAPKKPMISRADFVSFLSFTALIPSVSNAFDGGVGGLGKTRPQTGVIFKDAEIAAETTQSKTGDVTYELVAPDGSYVIVSFSSTIPLSKSSTGIECRDIQGGYESSFVQVCKLLSSGTTLDKINPGIIIDNIFGQAGKFGMYGSPTDVRVKKLPRASESSTDIYQATFTTLTPAMRESDRKALISASVVGDGLFLLVTTTTTTRFAKQETQLRKTAESFSAIAAPRSSLNQRK